MDLAEALELHYFLSNESHSMDAQVRNKCEADLISIFFEVASILEIETKIESFAYEKGGLKEKWKFLNKNIGVPTLLLAVVTLVLQRYPPSDAEKDAREKIIAELTIEEKKLVLEEKKILINKLKEEMNGQQINNNAKEILNSVIDPNLKIQAAKSNFYKKLSNYSNVSAISIVPLDSKNNKTDTEHFIDRANFRRFILSTDSLPTEKIEGAIIEIVSPVLREGFYHWKGIYENRVITFTITDTDFKQAVQRETISFQHGTVIECVLNINKKLNEVGEIIVSGYSVPVVIRKIDGLQAVETLQGKKYLHQKKLKSDQNDLF